METKHTPTPWQIDVKGEGAITGKDGQLIGRLNNTERNEERDANAAFIVRCVNAHDELVEALQDTTNAMSVCFQLCHAGGDMSRHSGTDWKEVALTMYATLAGWHGSNLKALRKARGEE